MKKITLLAFIFFPLIVIAQDLDKEFLSTLPEDIREDVQKTVKAKKDTEEPVYRSASTFIDKEEEDDDDDDITISQLFGSDFFDVMQSSFMPINEPNLDPSYILDFGDVLEIQLIGQEDSIEEHVISRDGSININEIGKIFVSGLSLESASSLIKAKINEAYIGTKVYISLKNVRDINILVVGNAYNPGIYTLNGNANMLHALSMAGGVNEYGSYRDISLVRNGEVIDNLDIYDVLIYGKYDLTSGLRSGDSIVVNPLLKLVSIESGVNRPAIYELKENEGFAELLSFANGYSKNHDKNNIIVKRTQNGINSIIELDTDLLKKFNFTDNDSLFIREFKVNTVAIKGAVKNPGTYKVSMGTTLSELISNAGGYDNSAYPFGGYLENMRALEINKESKKRLYDKFLNNLIISGKSTSSEDSNVTLLLNQVKNSPVTGRIIAEFDLELIRNDSNLDTILEDGDKIFIPSITQQVYVQGEVSNTGAIRYIPGKDISYYIKNSGGQLSTADMDNIFIVHPNGETTNLSSSSRLAFLQPEQREQLIYPGSIIYVPRNTNFANSLEVASIWAPIISSIALSLTSLSVLNNSN